MTGDIFDDVAKNWVEGRGAHARNTVDRSCKILDRLQIFNHFACQIFMSF
jgi:hypothetical protein